MENICISYFNHLSGDPTKWSNTLKQFVGNWPTNCLSVFDHFVGLVLKGLKTLLLKKIALNDANKMFVSHIDSTLKL